MSSPWVRAGAAGAGIVALAVLATVGVRAASSGDAAPPVGASTSPTDRPTPAGSLAPGATPTGPGSASAGAVDRTHPSGVGPVLDTSGRWRTSFVDDFASPRLDPAWYLYSGRPASGPGGFWAQSHVLMEGGELRLRTTYENGRWVSGGVARIGPQPLTYGKVQVRFRMAQATGVSYALLMWPDSEQWPPEIDFAEDGGGDRTVSTATLHVAPDNRLSQHHLHLDFSQWHTIGIEWTPGRIDYTVDGTVWASDTDGVPSQPMHLALQTQTWDCGLSYAQCPDSSTPPQTDLEIDWVTVQSWTGS